MEEKWPQSQCMQERKCCSRIPWIDAVRGLVIILVVFGHNIQFGSGSEMLTQNLFFKDPVFRFIYSFHMPCLMLVSGFFFARTVKKEGFWKNRVRALLIPIVTWSIIPAGIAIAKAVINQLVLADMVFAIGKIVLTYYWFLWAILFNSIIVWLVHRYFWDQVLVYICFGIVLLFIPDFLNTKLWIFMYPYFVTGYLWNVMGINVKWAKEHKMLSEGILITSFFGLLVFYTNDSFIYITGIAVRSFYQFKIDLYRYIVGFIGSATIIWMVYCLYPIVEDHAWIISNALCHCGRISLTIYTIDCLINSYLLPRMTEGLHLDYGIVLAETVVVVLFCIGSDRLIKRKSIMRKVLLGHR